MEPIIFDGMETALVGYGSQYPGPVIAVYSGSQIIEALMDQNMEADEALEWFYHNIKCLGCGEQTPLILDDL